MTIYTVNVLNIDTYPMDSANLTVRFDKDEGVGMVSRMRPMLVGVGILGFLSEIPEMIRVSLYMNNFYLF